MKTFLLSILLAGCCLLVAGQTATPTPPPETIYVAADHTFRGPFTGARPLLAGESATPITSTQYTAFVAVRAANPQAHKFAFDGTTFTVAPVEQLRLGLLAIFLTLSPAEQALFQPQLSAVQARLTAGDVPGAQLIVTLSGAGMTGGIATAQGRMLTLFNTLYPTTTWLTP